MTLETVRSILVHEETEDEITIRAASEHGTIRSALFLWWTLWRHEWLPHRWYAYDQPEVDWDDPSRWGWRWHGHDFLVRP